MPKEESKKPKKKKLKWQVKLILFIIILVTYSMFIGTKGIFIKDYKITSAKVTNEMHGLKIIHFSDLHFASSVNKNDVKQMVKKINKSKPDIVIFTGDLINKKHELSNEEKEFMINELKKINAEYGKYFVLGEDDFEESKSILTMAEFENIDEGKQVIYVNNKDSILLISNNDIKEYKEEENDENIKIFLTHNPNNYNKVKKYNFDVALAGHTHNGQINIPYVKDLFINSKYNKPYQKIGMTRLYVNSGIGTNNFNARLFNHPTINLYRLNKTSNK